MTEYDTHVERPSEIQQSSGTIVFLHTPKSPLPLGMGFCVLWGVLPYLL